MRTSPGLALAAPALAALAVFFFVPVLAAFALSLTDFDVYALADAANLRFVGLRNYARLLSDPLFWTALGNTAYFAFVGGPLSIEASRKRAEDYLQRVAEEYASVGTGFYAVVLKPEGLFIGRCGLLWQEVDGAKELEIGYGIAPEYWGRGLATEAARALRDLAFSRYVAVAPGTLQIRLEFFNLFNWTNLGLPDNFLGSPTFGQILSAGAPRRFQIGVRFLY